MRDLLWAILVIGILLFSGYEYISHQKTLPECVKSHEQERPFSGRMMVKTETVCDQYIQIPNVYYHSGIL